MPWSLIGQLAGFACIVAWAWCAIRNCHNRISDEETARMADYRRSLDAAHAVEDRMVRYVEERVAAIEEARKVA